MLCPSCQCVNHDFTGAIARYGPKYAGNMQVDVRVTTARCSQSISAYSTLCRCVYHTQQRHRTVCAAALLEVFGVLLASLEVLCTLMSPQPLHEELGACSPSWLYQQHVLVAPATCKKICFALRQHYTCAYSSLLHPAAQVLRKGSCRNMFSAVWYSKDNISRISNYTNNTMCLTSSAWAVLHSNAT